MKKTKLNLFMKTWALALVFLSIGFTANAKVWVAADSAQLAALLPVAGNPNVLSGDTIELPDGAVINASNTGSTALGGVTYNNTYLYINGKSITLKGADNAKVTPKIVGGKSGLNYLIQLIAQTNTSVSLTIQNIELDGKNVAQYGVYIGGSSYNFPKISLKGVYFHHFARGGFEPNSSNNIIDSLFVENCRFYMMGGGGYYAIRFNSNAVCKFAKIVNTTFSRITDGVFRNGGYEFEKKKVILDHCTFDSIAVTGTNQPFNFSAGSGGSSFIMTNCLISRVLIATAATANFWNISSAYTNNLVSNCRYFRIPKQQNLLTGIANFSSSFSELIPGFADTTNVNYAVSNASLLGASTDGTIIGDRMWGAAVASYTLTTPVVKGVINTFDRTITLNVPAGTDVSAIVPTFTLSAGATAKVIDVAQASGVTAVNLSNPVTYTVTGQDGSVQNWKVVVNQKDFTAFSFTITSPLGVINTVNKTISIAIPYGTVKTALIAKFASTGDSVMVGVVKQVIGTTPNDFTNPVTYKVYKNGTSADWTVSLVEDGAISAFSFAAPATTGLVTKGARTVSLIVPFGTDVTALVATFTQTGDSVKVGTVRQTSAVTANNFTSPVTYSVYRNSVIQNWTVTVVQDAAVTLFRLRSQVSSTIDKAKKTVSVVMPVGLSIANCIATFNTHANVTVSVGATTQTSSTTTNNFSSAVTYVFTPTTGIAETWTVTASAAGRVLTAFNIGSSIYTGILNYNDTSVLIPYQLANTSTARNATFILPTGYADTVGTTVQVSGTTTNNYLSNGSYVPGAPVIHKISDGFNKENWKVTAYPFGFRHFYIRGIGDPGVMDYKNKIVRITVPYSAKLDSVTPDFEIYADSVKTGTTKRSASPTGNSENGTAYNLNDTLKYDCYIGGSIRQTIKVIADKAPAKTVALLENLVTPLGKLEPAFSPDITTYNVMVPKGTPSATAAIVKALVQQNSYAKVLIDTAKLLPDTTIVTVTAEDGIAKKVYNVIFNQAACSINAFALNGGTVSTANAVPDGVKIGGSSTLVAKAAIGYEFVQWQDKYGNLVTKSNPYILSNIQTDVTLVAFFKESGKLTVFASTLSGGAVSATPASVSTAGSSTLIAIPEISHNFVKWTTKGGSDISTNDTVVVTNITTDTNLVAVFTYKQYSVTATTAANGTVTGSPQTINYGFNTANIIAVPSTGYHFVKWAKDGNMVSNNDTIVLQNITKDSAIVAYFDIDTFEFVATSGANGTITGDLAQIIDYGTKADTLIAIPANGYHFINWTKTGTSTEVSSNDTLVLANIVSDTAVTANFAINVYAVTGVAVTGGSITGTNPQPVNHGDNATALTAVPATGYHFVNWTITGTATEIGVSTIINLTSIISDTSVTANFGINTHTVAAEVAVVSTGTITGIPAGKVDYGTSVTLTAVPAKGYNFVNWTKGSAVLGTNTAIAIVVDKDTAITANFAIKTYLITVSVTPANSGSIVGAPTAAVDSGASVTLTASAADLYEFVNWTEGGKEVSAAFMYTFTASKARTLVANFKLSVGVINISKANVKVYPTVVSNHLTVESDILIKQISVFDMTGKLVMVEKLKLGSFTLNTSSFNRGIYNLIIETENGFVTSKFEVIK